MIKKNTIILLIFFCFKLYSIEPDRLQLFTSINTDDFVGKYQLSSGMGYAFGIQRLSSITDQSFMIIGLGFSKKFLTFDDLSRQYTNISNGYLNWIKVHLEYNFLIESTWFYWGHYLAYKLSEQFRTHNMTASHLFSRYDFGINFGFKVPIYYDYFIYFDYSSGLVDIIKNTTLSTMSIGLIKLL